MDDISERMYWDPKLDRAVSEDVIRKQYEFFKDRTSYLAFRENNFKEVEKIEGNRDVSVFCSDSSGNHYSLVSEDRRIEKLNVFLESIDSDFRTVDGLSFYASKGPLKGHMKNFDYIADAEYSIYNLKDGEDVMLYDKLIMQNMIEQRGFEYNIEKHCLEYARGSVASSTHCTIHEPSMMATIEHEGNPDSPEYVKAYYVEYSQQQEAGYLETDYRNLEQVYVREDRILEWLDEKRIYDRSERNRTNSEHWKKLMEKKEKAKGAKSFSEYKKGARKQGEAPQKNKNAKIVGQSR